MMEIDRLRLRYENLMGSIQRVRELGLIDREEATYLTSIFRDEFLSQCRASSLQVEKIIFNHPATIVFWADGTKTVVKMGRGERFDMYHGFTAAVAKKVYGNNTRVKKTVHKFEDSYRKNLEKKMERQTCCCCFSEDLRTAVNRHSGRYPWGSTSNEGADENE